ncbi:hemolymph lipopolysaccharide-binding protein-like [Chrysoperla carnea]|uniref:hemolymph lipopolysaccharide-binding protein-like n=1 Tax=Chrysoperla carnea TaxID=189513 RepID=UPI001D079955|nr:hemolymph lipopolysaccharide-binding protein-like [Chrysoperla carnea]
MQFIHVFTILVVPVLCVFANKSDTQNSNVTTIAQTEISQSVPININGKKYTFHGDPQVWNEARKICVSENGHLAIINSLNEAQTLSAQIYVHPKVFSAPNIDPSLRGTILIGFHDYFKQGEYVTLDGKGIEYSYAFWAQNQPNDNGGTNKCGAYVIGGGLRVVGCNVKGPFICEIEDSACRN